MLGIGTSSGGYLLFSDRARKKWKEVGPFLKGESVNCLNFDPKSKTLFAATHTDGVLLSKDLGKTWKQSSRGLHVKKAWTLEFDGGNLYAGTHYGHLFSSNDRGASWQEITGLFEAPKRKEWGIDWGFGTVGLCIHTVKTDPGRKNRFYIVSSGGGPYRTDDGGKTWSLLNRGVAEACPVGTRQYPSVEGQPGESSPSSAGSDGESARLGEHLATVHRCTHKLAVSSKTPDLLFQQNHCGVYRSTDAGESWQDISPSDDQRHGFPLVLVEDADKSMLFTIPANQGICKKHNSCIRGELAVYRTPDGGKAWERLTRGLPQKNNHTCILRDAMASDRLGDEPGVYFGTTTGEVYGTTDLGESWSLIMKDAGRVQGVSSFTLGR